MHYVCVCGFKLASLQLLNVILRRLPRWKACHMSSLICHKSLHGRIMIRIIVGAIAKACGRGGITSASCYRLTGLSFSSRMLSRHRDSLGSSSETVWVCHEISCHLESFKQHYFVKLQPSLTNLLTSDRALLPAVEHYFRSPPDVVPTNNYRRSMRKFLWPRFIVYAPWKK